MQILADHHGNLLHLYERDCSVQRRHQKVVEVAPGGESAILRSATNCAMPRCSSRAKRITAMRAPWNFCTTSTRSKWYFIEVNPRIQVEHTVTEMVTGIDIVRAQILVAQGHALHGDTMSLPRQESVPLYGAALQCRVTTEDPDEELRAGLREDFHVSLARGIRHSPGWRHGLCGRDDRALLRFVAGEGHGLGHEPSRGVPANGPRSARISHPRRQDEYSASSKTSSIIRNFARAKSPRLFSTSTRTVSFAAARAIARRGCSAISAT